MLPQQAGAAATETLGAILTGGGGIGRKGAFLRPQPTYTLVKRGPWQAQTAPGHRLLRMPGCECVCTRVRAAARFFDHAQGSLPLAELAAAHKSPLLVAACGLHA